MSMYGKDYDYANSRLNETIVRRGNVPVFVHSVGRGMKVIYSNLEEVGNVKECDIDELDLHPVPLGYCNYNKIASYLTRMPMRRDWRQGLRRGNFTTIGGGIQSERVPYEALHKTILGEYPTFKGALAAAAKVRSIAWHRHWALNSNDEVYYKGSRSPVGRIEGGQVILDESHQYLSEALKEAV